MDLRLLLVAAPILLAVGWAAFNIGRAAVGQLQLMLKRARAQAGEVVEVTSHRKPIARITAVKSPEQGSADPLQAAIEAGVVSWNGQKPVFPPPIKLKGQGKLISDIVIEDRG